MLLSMKLKFVFKGKLKFLFALISNKFFHNYKYLHNANNYLSVLKSLSSALSGLGFSLFHLHIHHLDLALPISLLSSWLVIIFFTSRFSLILSTWCASISMHLCIEILTIFIKLTVYQAAFHMAVGLTHTIRFLLDKW